MKCLLYLMLLAVTEPLAAQSDSVRLNGRFAFAEGLYGELESVTHNRPDYPWEEVNIRLVINPNTLLARLAPGMDKGAGKPFDVSTLWGFSRDGVLFRRLTELPPEGDASLFSAVWEKGRIGLYSFEREETRLVEIKAYVPQTGRPFRSARLPRTETVTVIVMLDFQTGATAELNRGNLLDWITVDTALWQRIQAMPPEEIDLVRAVQAFNDRNPLFIK